MRARRRRDFLLLRLPRRRLRSVPSSSSSEEEEEEEAAPPRCSPSLNLSECLRRLQTGREGKSGKGQGEGFSIQSRVNS
jgi:hypothetical protein